MRQSLGKNRSKPSQCCRIFSRTMQPRWKSSLGERLAWILLTGHGGQVQPQDRDIAFSLTSQMNYLQASSGLFLDSVPTTWVVLEYNIQSSAQANSEFVWISNSRRNCTSLRGLWMMSCKMDKTGLPLPHTKEWKLNRVMCQRAATTRGHETRGQLNATPQCSGGAQCQGGLGGWANRHLNS